MSQILLTRIYHMFMCASVTDKENGNTMTDWYRTITIYPRAPGKGLLSEESMQKLRGC